MTIRKTMGAAAVATLAMGAFQWALAYPEAHGAADAAPLEPIARHATLSGAQTPLSFVDEQVAYVAVPAAAHRAAPPARPGQARRIAAAALRFVFG